MVREMRGWDWPSMKLMTSVFAGSGEYNGEYNDFGNGEYNDWQRSH